MTLVGYGLRLIERKGRDRVWVCKGKACVRLDLGLAGEGFISVRQR